MRQVEYNPSFLFAEPSIYLSIFQENSKKQDYVLDLTTQFDDSKGFLECVSSFRELYVKVNGILKQAPNTLFEMKKFVFSEKDKRKREQIRMLLVKHNFHRNLEKRI